jgi:hypothetical protein
MHTPRSQSCFQTCAAFCQQIDWPNMMKNRLVCVLFFAAAFVFRCLGAGLIGEPAPPLTIKEWIAGKPVTIQPGTNIFLLEIWNSTSLASRACVTNLNHVQKRFQSNGVVVVGISDESPDRIRHFIQTDANVEYTVAADDRRQTGMRYLSAVKHRGVPYAFIVGTNGQVLWHGLPVAGLSALMDQILAGQYDVRQAKKSEQAFYQMDDYLLLLRRKDARSEIAGQRLLANRTNDVDLLCDMAYQITTDPGLPNRNFALASQALDQAEHAATTNNRAKPMIYRAVWLFASGKQDEGMILATQALAATSTSLGSNTVKTLIHTMQLQRNAAAQNATAITNLLNGAGDTTKGVHSASPGNSPTQSDPNVNHKPSDGNPGQDAR